MKFHLRILAGAFFLSPLGLVPATAQDNAGGDTKENLDLPFDAIGENEDEEEAPEIVSFYGQTLEADGFFYVVDKSGSMNDSGELAVAKREIIRNIIEFSDRVEFGVIFFAGDVLKFPPSGQATEATSGMKSAATRWINGVQSSHMSCPQLGLSAALRMASTCSAKRRVITYVGDGGGTCSGGEDEGQYLARTLAAVTAQNFQRIQINCIGVMIYPKLNEDFMRKLATSNGGTYTHITR